MQLTELIPVTTPLGDGYAVIFEGAGHDNYWTVAFDNGALVTFRQDQIKLQDSYTYGRGVSDAQMKKIIDK